VDILEEAIAKVESASSRTQSQSSPSGGAEVAQAHVESIHIAPAAKSPMQEVAEVMPCRA